MNFKKKEVFIIAEIGVNHNGSLSIAKKLIDYASKSGFDAVKFQTWDPNLIALENTHLAPYQKMISNSRDQKSFLKKFYFSYEQFKVLNCYCKKKKITFISTPFDNSSADFLQNINIPFFKVGSGDNDNLLLLKYIKKFNKTIVLSTGMINFKRLKKVLNFLNMKKNKLVLMHCISAYPTMLKDTQLGVINELKNLSNIVGFSDHTEGFDACISAISLGATIIEKHITLDKTMIGPDHRCSLECKDFALFIKTMRQIKASINDNKRYITNNEFKNLLVAKKSLYFVNNFKKDHIITESSFKLSRPRKLNSDPLNYQKIINKKLKYKVKKNSVIKTD
jgi:N,N'-diacetyllegionaminate synthase